MFTLFLNETPIRWADDSLAVQMENQNNGDAIEPTARTSNNNNSSNSSSVSSDNGEPPHFVRANDLPEIIHKPSGNTVRIRCPAAGKPTECERDKFPFTSNK